MAGESAREQAARARAESEKWLRRAQAWEKGAEGESLTAAALADLDGTWTVWHDLHWPGRQRANLDHLVIGPGGVFVVDSKNWSGAVTLRDGVLRQQGYRRDREVAAAGEAALAIARLVPRYADRVRGVVCLVRPETMACWSHDVLVCSSASLPQALTAAPEVLGVDEVADAVLTLQARLRSTAEAARARPETVADPWPVAPAPAPPTRSALPARAARPARPARHARPARARAGATRRRTRSGVVAPIVVMLALAVHVQRLPDAPDPVPAPTTPRPAAPGGGGAERGVEDPGVGQPWRPRVP